LAESAATEQFGTAIPFTARTGLKALALAPEGVKLMMPFEPNINHVNVMYAGALFTLAETVGGAVTHVYLKKEGTFPIVKGLNIKFTRPARTDITVDYRMDPREAERILAECEERGKANYDVRLELKDADGQVVALSEGFYQLRKGTTF